MKTIAYVTHPIRYSFLFMVLMMTACTTPVSRQPTVTPSPIVRMTIVGNTTLTPTITPGDFPTVTPHIYCEDTPESFLIIGDRGRVTQTDDGETLNLRDGPGIVYRVLERIDQLETFYVTDGPQCSDGYTWFEINYRGRVGWIAEGDENQYYAEPFLTG